MNEQEQRDALIAAFNECTAKGSAMTPDQITDRLLSAVELLVDEARNDERESIACYLESQGHHHLAGEIFAGLTRPVNESLRSIALGLGAANLPKTDLQLSRD